MSKENSIETDQGIYHYPQRPSMQGALNPRWNGGISDYPNHYLLKKVRLDKLKASQGKCETCGNLARVVHHIDENKANHDISNLVALCSHCHSVIHNTSEGCKTSKYIRIYGMTLKDVTRITGLYYAIIMTWTKNLTYRNLLVQALGDGKDEKTIRANVNELWTKIKDEEYR